MKTRKGSPQSLPEIGASPTNDRSTTSHSNDKEGVGNPGSPTASTATLVTGGPGPSTDAGDGPLTAEIGPSVNGRRRRYLGTFSTRKEAAYAYDANAIEVVLGSAARLNFPLDQSTTEMAS